MQLRLNSAWLILVFAAGFLSLLYLWFTLFPGRVLPEAGYYFSAEQINQGRQYNMILRLAYICGFLGQVSFLLWLVFSGRLTDLSRWVQRLTGDNYWGSLLLFFLIIWLSLQLLNIPFTLYSGYFWQHQWGFSTQTLGAWWVDYCKSAGLDLFLSTAGVVLLFGAINRWPGTWWLAGAAIVSLWLVIQTFFWPVVIAPLFNRFTPSNDPTVLSMVHELSEKARLPVGQVLIMDASRRTTKANAYFTGLGQTKRIVLYDTLLADYPPDQVKAVVAHEMAHWSRGHIIRGLALGVLGNIFFWGLLFVLLRTSVTQFTRYPPHVLALILLFFLLASFAGNPLQNYFSRGMEVEADHVAVSLTGDVPAALRLQVDLAARNLSDVAPPAFIHWFSYSHPSALNRIKKIKQAGEDSLFSEPSR
ncbi:M48 family metallopeptidase [Pelotomaculum sp. PtaB.Bin117]|uniref:M48 family metallopeptidase n=1 Tax=Pelotomaculum sp. PtaB.Bin117 TaxID=1811694 RepID=UPI00257EA4A9|nr:M48 family metallopeptidase [Pelotomaculum sp. PtaB.Bin117]